MLFWQLGGAKSLREICGGLAATEGKLRHLGLPQAPPRSTLASANEHRRWQLYEDVFQQLLTQCQALAVQQSGGQRKFRFKHKLISLDVTVIDLCASVFDWARFRRTKGAVRLHLLLDHDGFQPCHAVLTEGKQHEVGVARQLHYEPATLLVMDRSYNDYTWFAHLTQQGVHFVTRMKDNADYLVLQDRELPRRKGVVRDQGIYFYQEAHDGQECYFRRIEFYDEEQDRVLVFVTNHLTLAAATVAEVYKQR